MREEDAARVETRIYQVEEAFVIGLPRVEKYEIECPVQLRDLRERVTMNHAHDIGESRLLDVCRRFLRSLRVVLDRDDVAVRLPGTEAQPDSAVAAGRTDLENRFRIAHPDQDPHEASVLLGDRELPLVGGLDLLENRFDLRRERARRWALLRGGCDDEEHDRETGEQRTHRE